MLNEGRDGSSVGAWAPLVSQTGLQRASIAAGSKDLASSVMVAVLRWALAPPLEGVLPRAREEPEL